MNSHWSRIAAKAPEDRPSTAGEAEEALWAYLYDHISGRTPMSSQTSWRSAFHRKHRLTLRLEGWSPISAPRGGATNLTDVSQIGTQTITSASDNIKLPRLLRGNSGERKSVVVLMAEVTGFTALSLSADASEVVRWHYKLLRRLRRVVDRHGGLLESYQDDRFMVLFGVPRASEHDLERAVACAEAIQALTEQGSLRRQRIAVSIGIHRGDMTMGGKSGRTVRYLARGDTVKLAHRLCRRRTSVRFWSAIRWPRWPHIASALVLGPPCDERGGGRSTRASCCTARETAR